MTIRGRELEKRPVVTAAGRVIGDVADVVIDDGDWRVKQLIIEIRSTAAHDLGVAKPLWRRATLALPIEDVQAVSDTVVLRLTVDELVRQLHPPAPEGADPAAPPR